MSRTELLSSIVIPAFITTDAAKSLIKSFTTASEHNNMSSTLTERTSKRPNLVIDETNCNWDEVTKLIEENRTNLTLKMKKIAMN
jgi:N-acetylglucosamine-6-phosphate deacetylase